MASVPGRDRTEAGFALDPRLTLAAYRRRAFEFEMSTLRRGSMVRTADGRWVDCYDNENDRLMDAWAWRMGATYRHLSYYPWLAAEPDPPPPRLLAHARSRWTCPSGTIQ